MPASYTYSGNIYDTPGVSQFALTSTAGNPIPYLEKAHIHVATSTNDGQSWTALARPADWDFDGTGTKVDLTSPLAAGTWLRVLRVTPYLNRYTTFQESSLLTSDQLNAGEDFSMYVDQEIRDEVAINSEGAVIYKGNIDLTADNAPLSPVVGWSYFNTGVGLVIQGGTPGWDGIVGDPVTGGERVIYNGSEWELIDTPSGQIGVISVTSTAPIVTDNTDPQRPVVSIPASSSTQDGSMSKEDKAKLDGIDTSAGGIITDAPNDGKQYCRESQAWAQVSIPPGTIISATQPTSADNGQLWFNTTDNRLYICIDETASPPTFVETSPAVVPMTVGTSGPSSPAEGELWYDTNTGRAYVYIDGDTDAWVDQNPGGGGGTTKGGGQNLVFQENEMICTEDYQLTAGRSALSAGPITIQNGKTITIPNNQNWVIL